MKDLSRQVRRQSFQAHYRHEASKSFYVKAPGGNTNFMGKLYVDSFGREREETYIVHDSEWELTFVDIWDTVDLKAYILNVEDKTILYQDSLDMNTFSRELDIGVPGIMTYCIPRHSLYEGKDLGSIQIEGLTCKGSRRNFPGYKECPGGVIECWYSDAISYVVFVKAIFDDVENVFQLFNIELVEPYEELFIIPADYKQANIGSGECCFGKNDGCPSRKSNPAL